MDPIFTTVVRGRCPVCGEGPLFSGVFEMHQKCSRCGVTYNRHPGSWTTPTVMGYMLGVIVGMVGLFGMWVTDNLWPGSEFILAAVVCVVVLGSFRFLKAWWVGIQCQWGMVYADPPKEASEGG